MDPPQDLVVVHSTDKIADAVRQRKDLLLGLYPSGCAQYILRSHYEVGLITYLQHIVTEKGGGEAAPFARTYLICEQPPIIDKI